MEDSNDSKNSEQQRVSVPGASRKFELNAFSAIVDSIALKDNFCKDSAKFLKDAAKYFCIPTERFRAEIRRASSGYAMASQSESWTTLGKASFPVSKASTTIDERALKIADLVANKVHVSPLPTDKSTETLEAVKSETTIGAVTNSTDALEEEEKYMQAAPKTALKIVESKAVKDKNMYVTLSSGATLSIHRLPPSSVFQQLPKPSKVTNQTGIKIERRNFSDVIVSPSSSKEILSNYQSERFPTVRSTYDKSPRTDNIPFQTPEVASVKSRSTNKRPLSEDSNNPPLEEAKYSQYVNQRQTQIPVYSSATVLNAADNLAKRAKLSHPTQGLSHAQIPGQFRVNVNVGDAATSAHAKDSLASTHSDDDSEPEFDIPGAHSRALVSNLLYTQNHQKTHTTLLQPQSSQGPLRNQVTATPTLPDPKKMPSAPQRAINADPTPANYPSLPTHTQPPVVPRSGQKNVLSLADLQAVAGRQQLYFKHSQTNQLSSVSAPVQSPISTPVVSLSQRPAAWGETSTSTVTGSPLTPQPHTHYATASAPYSTVVLSASAAHNQTTTTATLNNQDNTRKQPEMYQPNSGTGASGLIPPLHRKPATSNLPRAVIQPSTTLNPGQPLLRNLDARQATLPKAIIQPNACHSVTSASHVTANMQSHKVQISYSEGTNNKPNHALYVLPKQNTSAQKVLITTSVLSTPVVVTNSTESSTVALSSDSQPFSLQYRSFGDQITSRQHIASAYDNANVMGSPLPVVGYRNSINIPPNAKPTLDENPPTEENSSH